MLSIIRNNQRVRNVVLFAVVLLLAAYVLVGFGSAPPVAQSDTIATIGSVNVKLHDAFIQQENLLSQFRQLDRDNLQNFTVSQLLSNAVLLDGAKKLNLSVSDAELRDMVIRNRTRPDGSFVSDEEWAAAINSRYRIKVETLERYMREYGLRTQKFRELFSDTGYVSEKAIADRFARDNQKVKIEMVALSTFEVRGEIKTEKDEEIARLVAQNPDDFRSGDQRQVRFIRVPVSKFDADVQVTDAEIQDYYNANLARYQVAESVTASHVLIKVDKRSDQEALALANKVKAELDGGLDFAEAAKKYSEDEGTKVRGGDLGLFRRGAMVKPFEDAAFSMAVNTISNPVRSEFGYHIIKKTAATAASTRTLEEVRPAVTSTVKRTKAKDGALDVAKTFHGKLASGVDFVAAAKEVDYEVMTSNFFDSDNNSNLGEGLRNTTQVRKPVFDLKSINDFTEPINLTSEIVVMQWVAEAGPRPLTMEQDAVRIRALAQDVAAKAFIKSELSKIREAALKEPSKTLKDLRGNRSWIKDNNFTNTEWVDANSLPYDLRSEGTDFAKDIYTLEVGQFLPNLETSSDTRFALARVVEKQEPDMSKLEGERHTIIDQLSSEAGGDLFAAYMFAMLEKVDADGKVQAKLAEALKQR